jgi:hypothetical protein
VGNDGTEGAQAQRAEQQSLPQSLLARTARTPPAQAEMPLQPTDRPRQATGCEHRRLQLTAPGASAINQEREEGQYEQGDKRDHAELVLKWQPRKAFPVLDARDGRAILLHGHGVTTQRV